MTKLKISAICLLLAVSMVSCVSKKKFKSMEESAMSYEKNLAKCNSDLTSSKDQIDKLRAELGTAQAELKANTKAKDEQVTLLKSQVTDLQKSRDQQMIQVEGMTVLSKTANTNVEKTLSQLAQKDKYISLLQAAKTKADSINLALAVNLKSSLGIDLLDPDIDIKVDKTVVMINLSDGMLYKPGSFQLSTRANEILGKIAKIINSRPDVEVMVEGYTDNTPIKTSVLDDNWDLSVKRSTSVVRALQKNFSVNPDRLIAAGRGEYNALVKNDSPGNKAINRRTRIILMPKLDQFYDLLNPDMIK